MTSYKYDPSVVVLYRERGSTAWRVDENFEASGISPHDYIMAQECMGMHYKIEATYSSRTVRSAEEIVRELKRWYWIEDEEKYGIPENQGRFDSILKGDF